MKNLRYSALLAVVLIASIGSLQAAPPTQITAPQVITVSGSYILANNITATASAAGNEDGIDIRASDVTLNLNGHTITVSQGNAGTGIAIDGGDNAHVSNGKIIVNGSGIGVEISSSYCLLNGLNITGGSGGWGIYIYLPGNYNSVHNCIVSGAFILGSSSHNTIQNNTLVGTPGTTILESDRDGTGDNTFIGNEFSKPIQ